MSSEIIQSQNIKCYINTFLSRFWNLRFKEIKRDQYFPRARACEKWEDVKPRAKLQTIRERVLGYPKDNVGNDGYASMVWMITVKQYKLSQTLLILKDEID